MNKAFQQNIVCFNGPILFFGNPYSNLAATDSKGKLAKKIENSFMEVL